MNSTRVAALVSAVVIFVSGIAQGQTKPKPLTPEEERATMQGAWHVLSAQEAEKEKTDDPAFKGSTVTLTEKRLEWKDANGKVLWSADCQWKHVGKPAWELDLTPTVNAEKSEVLPGIGVLFDKDILKLSYRRINLEKGRPTALRGDKEHTCLLLRREAAGKPSDKPNPVGDWQMLASFDDAFDRLGAGRYAGAILQIEADKIAWKTSKNDKGAKYAGGYTLDPSKSPKQIKFNITFPPPGVGATPTPKDGIILGIYEFIDDDTLRIAYRESWRGPISYPDGFYSDGGMNLWIVRRIKP